MSRRIRYIKGALPGEYVGSQYHTSSTGQTYHVMFKVQDDQPVSYRVEDLTGAVLEEGVATSTHKAKIAIKAALIKLGCTFDNEVRKKRYED